MLEKALPKMSTWSFCSSSDRYYIRRKRDSRLGRNSRIILSIFFFITLVSGIESSTMSALQVYGQIQLFFEFAGTCKFE